MSESTDRFTQMAVTWTKFAATLKDVGFPVAVTAYLLVSLNPKIDALIASVQKLVVIMENVK